MMKDNSTAGSHSKRRIIAAAKDLFHQQGVRATQVDEILQASGVSRREFNRSFRSKQKLAKEVVLAYLADIESGRSCLHPKLASWSDFERSLARHVIFLKQFKMLRGCPLAIIGNELTEKDDAVRQVLSTVFEALTKRMTAFFRKQKTEGHLSRSANEEGLAEFCVAVIQGAILVGKVRGESQAVEHLLDEVTNHFEQGRLVLS
jgi:TetR/AcrR family transcriptional regulator, transcriptional repressor for nem operon